jgi:NAD+ synthase (glutamine-hydrolysing)
MRIALCQLNYTIGDFDGNTAKIIAAIDKAKAGGAELAVFSELSVCGYPPLDFLENRDFIQSCQL